MITSSLLNIRNWMKNQTISLATAEDTGGRAPKCRSRRELPGQSAGTARFKVTEATIPRIRALVECIPNAEFGYRDWKLLDTWVKNIRWAHTAYAAMLADLMTFDPMLALPDSGELVGLIFCFHKGPLLAGFCYVRDGYDKGTFGKEAYKTLQGAREDLACKLLDTEIEKKGVEDGLFD